MFHVGQTVRVDLSEYPSGIEVDGVHYPIDGEVSVTGKITAYHGGGSDGREWVVKLDIRVGNLDSVLIEEKFLQAVG